MAQYFPTRWTIGESFAGSFFDSLARKQENERYEEEQSFRNQQSLFNQWLGTEQLATQQAQLNATIQDRVRDDEFRGKHFAFEKEMAERGLVERDGKQMTAPAAGYYENIDRYQTEQERYQDVDDNLAARLGISPDTRLSPEAIMEANIGLYNAETGRINATASTGINSLLKQYKLRELERAEQARSDQMRFGRSTVNPDGRGIVPSRTRGDTSFLGRMVDMVTNPVGPAAGFGMGAIKDTWGPGKGSQEKNATTITNNLEPYKALANSFVNLPPESQQAVFQSQALQEARRDLVNAAVSLGGEVRGLTPEVRAQKLQEIDMLYRQITGGVSIESVFDQRELENAQRDIIINKAEGN